MALSDVEKAKLQRLLAVVEQLRAVDPEMPLTTVATLLLVATEGDVVLVDVTERFGVAQSTASRSLNGLTAKGRARRPGYGLAEQHAEPNELRVRLTNLSAEGESLCRSMLAQLEVGDTENRCE